MQMRQREHRDPVAAELLNRKTSAGTFCEINAEHNYLERWARIEKRRYFRGARKEIKILQFFSTEQIGKRSCTSNWE